MKRMLIILFCLSHLLAMAQPDLRARDLGIPFEGTPGKYNAITDVPGVLVGYKTLIAGSGKLVVGKGPVRTGVTVILPKGKTNDGYPAAWFSLNGDGEMTGLPYIEDYGMSYGAIGITNTNSVGIVKDAIGSWNVKHFSQGEFVDYSFGLPVAAETWDGGLNDINGFHVKAAHVWEALDSAKSGAVQEGNVGGGTGMVCYEFKGGSGTASRIFTIDSNTYTLGVFVQANFGGREELMVAGVPAGKEITGLLPVYDETGRKDGSIIVIVGTDAPLLPGQLKQAAKRITHGIARTGTYSHNGSGEIFLAFSTATPQYNKTYTAESWKVIPKWELDPVYKATVEATEEAILNALTMATSVTGRDGHRIEALDLTRLRGILWPPQR